MRFMIDLLRLTFTNPNAAGLHILELRPSFGTALSAFMVTIIIAVVLMFALNGFQAAAILPGFPAISPVKLAMVMGIGTLGLVGTIWLTAQAFGGNGSLTDGILVFAWIQMLQVLLQIVQTALMLVSITLAGLVSLIATGLLFWILFGLLNSWLNLESMWKAAACFVISVIGLSMAGAFILVSFGVSPGQVAL